MRESDMFVQVQSGSLKNDHITVGANRYAVDARGNAYVNQEDAAVLVEHIGFSRIREMSKNDIPHNGSGKAPRTWQDFLTAARQARLSPGDLRRMAAALESEQSAAKGSNGTIAMPPTSGHVAPKPAEPVANIPPPPPEARKPPQQVAPEFEVVDWTSQADVDEADKGQEEDAKGWTDGDPTLDKSDPEPERSITIKPAPIKVAEREVDPEPVAKPRVNASTSYRELTLVAKDMGLKVKRTHTKAVLLKMIKKAGRER